MAILDYYDGRYGRHYALHGIRKKSKLPIIMLSAKDQDMDKVLGLTAGADDYLAKPFNPN